MPEGALRALFESYPDVLYGFAEIGYSPYAAQYASALVFAVPYGEQLTPQTYAEERFERGILAARARVEEIAGRVEAILQARAIRYWTPPVAQENETELLAPFSFKYAAVRAGLGWIGRNDVLVTRRCGPRVRLSAILIDAPFAYGPPTLRSECPEDCLACVQACPCKALSGRLWDPGALRRELIDYHRCNRMRSAYIGTLGRKNACGLCMTACPIGRPSNL